MRLDDDDDDEEDNDEEEDEEVADGRDHWRECPSWPGEEKEESRGRLDGVYDCNGDGDDDDG